MFLNFPYFASAGGSSCDKSTRVPPRLILLLRGGAGTGAGGFQIGIQRTKIEGCSEKLGYKYERKRWIHQWCVESPKLGIIKHLDFKQTNISIQPWTCGIDMPLTKQMTRWTNETLGEWGQNSDRMVDDGGGVLQTGFGSELAVNISAAFQTYSQSLMCQSWVARKLGVGLVLRHRFWADTVETSQYYPILMQQKPLFGMIGHALVQREYRGSTGTTVGIPLIEEPFALTSGKAQNPVSHVVRSGQTCRMVVVCGSFM